VVDGLFLGMLASGMVRLVSPVGDIDIVDFLRSAPYQFWLFAALAVASEIVPFVASRFQRLLLPVFMSVCFAFAVLILYGLAPALLVQSAAILGAWLRLRLTPWRILAIWIRLDASLVVASVVFDVITGQRLAPGAQITGSGLFAVLAAIAGWFATNYLLLVLDAWLRQGARWRQALNSVLPYDLLPYDLLSNAALLMLAPSLVSGPGWVIVLLVVPLAVVGQMARLSGEEDRQARADPVTGLLSRRAFMSDVNAMRRDRRGRLGGGPSYALFLLDLDRFKHVNDALGHEVGDRVLGEVGRRLAAGVRPGDLVSRLGGDEFIVVAIGVNQRSDAAALADRIKRYMDDPIVIDGLPIDVGYSVGVALYPDDGEDLASVMRHADGAMYTAKQRGGGLVFYSGETEARPREGLSLLADLRRALEKMHPDDEVALRYQPVVSIADGRVVAAEGILDWRRPRNGLVDPDEVFRVAENTPVMRRLTKRVVDEAMDRLVAWRLAGRQLRVSVNISARDLETTELAEFLAQRLRRDAISPELIALEVDEGALMADPGRFRKALGIVADCGIGLCLDDFGTGHCAIQDLRRLPLTELKIDRSLVCRMAADSDCEAVVRAIIDLGAVLELRVVAVGVENEATHRLLASHHCPVAQGAYYAGAMAPEQLDAWLDRAGQSS
jgi:diguanylate cyclase